MVRKILIMGLPGAGKTTLAYALSDKLNAIVIDGDDIRRLHQHVDFSEAGRVQQAMTIRDHCEMAMANGHTAIASFVCPTPECRAAFWGQTMADARFEIFVDRIVASEFQDTNKMFVPPFMYDYRVEPGDTVALSVANILNMMARPMDWEKPTAVFIGRYQPFHQGHKALIELGIKKYGQAWIGVRTMPRDEKNPYDYFDIEDMIYKALGAEYAGKFSVDPLPNVASVMYGRDVGYKVEQVRLPPELEEISATKIRAGEQL